jgi:2-methylaconitate cis-trans-isomerase PrpF
MKRVTMLLAAGLIMLAAAALPTIRAGAQQAVVTDENLDQMITSAKSPADHDAIAAFFEQEAADATKKANLHKGTAETYRKLKIPKPVYMAEMCDGIASGFEKTAKDAENLAKMHHEMAIKAGATTAP